MTALGDWLKQMVIVVLLAVLTDFLLPTQAMQKYVRTVMSLAIIAIMLGPIVPFMKPDWADKVASVAISEFDKGQTGVNLGSAQTTASLYNQTLTEEESTTTNTLVQSDVEAALPPVYRPFVTSIQLSQGTTGQSIVDVTCHSLNSLQEKQLASSIAATLQTVVSNIHVHE